MKIYCHKIFPEYSRRYSSATNVKVVFYCTLDMPGIEPGSIKIYTSSNYTLSQVLSLKPKTKFDKLFLVRYFIKFKKTKKV